MLNYDECLNIVKKKIPGKFLTYCAVLQSGKYSFLYFDKEVGKNKDQMPSNPEQIIVDPNNGKVEWNYDYMKKGWEAFDKDGTPEGDQISAEILSYTPIEDSYREIMAYT